MTRPAPRTHRSPDPTQLEPTTAAPRLTPGRRLFALSFLLINLALTAYFLDVVPTPNSTSRVLPVLAVYEQGTYAIDRYQANTMDKALIEGHYYSDKAPLSTWIVMPFYGLLRASHLSGSAGYQWRPVALIGDVLCGTLPFVIFLWFVFTRVHEQWPRLNPVMLATLPLYGSLIFVYAGTFMSHVLAGTLLCGAYFLITRATRHAIAGGLTGLAVLAEFPTVLAVPLWFAYIYRRDRQAAVWFLVGGAPCAAALLLYNHAITGSLATAPYAYIASESFAAMRSVYGMTWPSLDVMWQLLVPPYRGLFFYAPALIVVAVGYLFIRARRTWRADLTGPLAPLVIATLLLISSYFAWSGGWSYGPRHLVPIAMLLFYAGLPLVAGRPALRAWTYTLSVVGIGMAWVSKATALYLMPETYANPVVEVAIRSFRRGELRHDALPTQILGTPPLTAAWLWIGALVIGVTVLHLLYDATDEVQVR